MSRPGALTRSRWVTTNALAQLVGDRRFLAVSLVVPLVVIFLLSVFWDALDTPLLQQERFAVPGGAFIVHFVTYVLTAIVLVRERVAGTMERMFIDGYRPVEIVCGYLLAYTALATVQSVLILVELTALFDLGLSIGEFSEILAVMWLLAVVSLAMGMLVSNFARNEGQVFPFIPLVMIPPVFLSGLVVAVEALPEWAQLLSLGIPLRYAVDVLHTITDGGALADTLGAFSMLPLLGLVVLAAAATTLREEI